MSNILTRYAQKWSFALCGNRQPIKLSPKAWAFISFIAPIVAVPLAIEAGKKVYEYAKKEHAKRKKK